MNDEHDRTPKQEYMDRRRFFKRSAAGAFGLAAAGSMLSACGTAGRSDTLQVATFEVDATPPVGGQLAYQKAQRVDEPLSARGIVLLAPSGPIVLAAVDWIAVSNAGYDAWRMALAEAAGTAPDRVTIHALHQHDAPGCDFDLDQLMAAHGKENGRFDPPFAWKTIGNVSQSIREGLENTTPVTHLGTGKARVEKFASTRRLLGADGNVKYVRFTSTGGRPELRELPEGLIDPYVRVISLWNGDEPIVALTYYATHPQSYYREGGISCDTVGIARSMRQEETGVFHVHFAGAGGNIGAGKYNDGSHENRQILAKRLADGIAEAWNTTEKSPVAAADVDWRVKPVKLPVQIREETEDGEIRTVSEEEVRQNFVENPTGGGARDLTWIRRMEGGHHILLSALELGDSQILHMPGELFVEYQLAAQEMRPDAFVAMAAYGDDGPAYIGTRSSYPRGGYEVGSASRVAPGAEDVLTDGMRELLRAPESATVMPSDFTEKKQPVE